MAGSCGRAASENPDLFWGLRGGGGNFGVVTEFEFRLHPTTGRALIADLYFDLGQPAARAAMRAWRDRLHDAPRPATLTSDVMTAGDAPFLPESLRGRPVVTVGFVWVGEMADARRYLDDFRRIGTPDAESVDEMRYIDLQSIGDERHHHGLRRYSAGHYLTELSDAAIDAYLSRGIPPTRATRTRPCSRAAGSKVTAARSPRWATRTRPSATARRWSSSSPVPPGPTRPRMTVRMSGARAWAAALAPFSSGTYVNVIADPGEEGVGRAYHAAQLERLAEIKRAYDPDNVFHLNQNIRPAAPTRFVASRSSVRGTVGSCRTTPDASYSRGMSAVRDRCPACARRLITTRFDTTFRLPDRSERLCFGIPGGLCEDCSQLYIDPELIELLDLGEGRCVFAIESDLVVQEQAWSSGH